MKYRVIYHLREKYPVTVMSEYLGVSRSGYYAWVDRLGQTDRDSAAMEMVVAAYQHSHRTYGYRRVTDWLQRRPETYLNHKRVLRLMRKLGIRMAWGEHQPQALFINFSNPESRIILALGKYSPIAALGLCHGIFMGQNDVARILGLPADEVAVLGAGLNHSQCLMQIRHRATGEDLYPLLRDKEKDFDPAFVPLTRRLFRAFGYWMTCSDDHLGEYLAYGWEGGEHGYDFDANERRRADFARTLDRVLAGGALPPDWLTPSGERGGAVIGGVLHNKKRILESGIVLNRGAIPNLPADGAVEIPVMADAGGIHPISLGPLPDAIAKLLHTQVSVQQLAVEAAMHGSKQIALQALLIDPVVNSASAAVKLLDELWDVNRPYIRSCI